MSRLLFNMTETSRNIDPAELDKFEAHAGEWWDPKGTLRTLHQINPVRLQYIDRVVQLAGKRVLDLGCGGGILAEAMAARGARVTGVDANAALIDIAAGHAQQAGLEVEYVVSTGEDYAASISDAFDAVTCLELLEHVPDVASLLRACAVLLEPGGHLILATINRTALAYGSAILAAEYLLGLLPKGTHDYTRFIRPSELAHWLRDCGFSVRDIAGMTYIPGLDVCTLTGNPAINYLMHAQAAAR